jgi:hypothetical protein
VLEIIGNGGERQGNYDYGLGPNGFVVNKKHKGMTPNACCIVDVCKTRRIEMAIVQLCYENGLKIFSIYWPLNINTYKCFTKNIFVLMQYTNVFFPSI